MLKSACWRGTALLLAVGLILPVVAGNVSAAGLGGEAARASMHGSLIIPTTGHMTVWGHMILEYGWGTELVSGQYPGGGDSDGQGRVWWGLNDKYSVMIEANRYDTGYGIANFAAGGTIKDSASGFSSGFPNISSYSAWDMGQIINGTLAGRLNNGGAWSAGLRFGKAGEEEKDEDSGIGKDASTAIGAQFSWTNGNGTHVAASFDQESQTVENDNAGTIEEDKGSRSVISVLARHDRGDHIFHAGVGLTSASEEPFNDPAIKNEQSSFALLLSAGKFLKNDSDGQASLEGFLSYGTDTDDPDDVATGGAGAGEFKQDSSALLIPGVRASCWEMFATRWGVMLGATAWWATASSEVTADGDVVSDSSFAGMQYSWAGGVFFQASDSLRLDFNLQVDELGRIFNLGNNGPDMICFLGGVGTFN